MKKKILVVGSSNIDLIMKMDRLPKRGETVVDAIFMQTFGGKGANQAVGAVKAGGDVYFANCVGDDRYGTAIIDNMKAAGIHTDYIFQEKGIASGTALIMIGGDGENYISVAPGANYRLSPTHIDQVNKLIPEAAILLLQYEITEETLHYVVDIAYAAGVPVMLNLAPARPIQAESLRKLTYLVVNETEAEFLCGFPVNSPTAIEHAAHTLLSMGPKTVILTMGAQGSIIVHKDKQQKVPAFKVKAIDTTAAGDIFCGSLATALVEGKSLEAGIRFASAASAISVTRLGAQPSTPTREEIDTFLANHPEESLV
jgi:ribokinase